MEDAMNDQSRWESILSRRPDRDGAFVFAVRTTGIYCRPSCPSRRPKRENVAFYPCPADAERAGFRACLRCRPDAPAALGPRAALVREACRLIDASQASLTLEALASRLGRSPHYLHRAFRKSMGITPRQYADSRKMNRFRASARGNGGVTGAIFAAGFGSSSRLYERAGPHLGMTPATYGRRGAGAVIQWTVAPCALGKILVAATSKGICAVRLGDGARGLVRELRSEFSAADIRRDGGILRPAVAALLEHLNTSAPPPDLPLDVRATAFQRLVWERLRGIPLGEVRTYSGIAKEMRRPSSARAVARAIASNPIALLVPCHRVVRSDGEAGGYRWGAERKAALLAREARLRPGGRSPRRPPRPSRTRTS
jgi:AraC family transcriptional regulator of adaptative response/methylated-DNA-[protein]-cysteine methyltransferase